MSRFSSSVLGLGSGLLSVDHIHELSVLSTMLGSSAPGLLYSSGRYICFTVYIHIMTPILLYGTLGFTGLGIVSRIPCGQVRCVLSSMLRTRALRSGICRCLFYRAAILLRIQLNQLLYGWRPVLQCLAIRLRVGVPRARTTAWGI